MSTNTIEGLTGSQLWNKLLQLDANDKLCDAEGNEIQMSPDSLKLPAGNQLVTVNADGEIVDDLGNYVVVLEGKLILDTQRQSNEPDGINLIDYTVFSESAVYEVHCFTINTTADVAAYEKFIYSPDSHNSDRVAYANMDNSNYTWSINSDILSASGGGGRSYRVRINRIM